jgi:predicted RNA polymerase sigma factor
MSFQDRNAQMTASSAIDSERLESDYYLWHATHADLARQTGDFATARTALEQAWKLAPPRVEKD